MAQGCVVVTCGAIYLGAVMFLSFSGLVCLLQFNIQEDITGVQYARDGEPLWPRLKDHSAVVPASCCQKQSGCNKT